MTFYRKYRPQKFSDVVGQPQVTEVISRAVAAGQPAHAYLFAGPRGTGKTSVARILAKAVNCINRQEGEAEPCNECENCRAINSGGFLDVQEIDAASQTSVEGIRELTEQIAISPAFGRVKVYILDEAHMLSASAFNALLKTLEEPPAHAIFVLCTTEAHKIPVTIASRCQRLTFMRAEIGPLTEQLRMVAAAENVVIDADALEAIASLADGGFRDGEMLLEQLVAGRSGDGPLTRQDVEQKLGLASRETIVAIMGYALDARTADLVAAIEAFAAGGGHIRQLTDSLLDLARDVLLATVDAALVEAGEGSDIVRLASHASQASVLKITRSLLEARQQLQFYTGSHQALAIETALLDALQPVVAPSARPDEDSALGSPASGTVGHRKATTAPAAKRAATTPEEHPAPTAASESPAEPKQALRPDAPTPPAQVATEEAEAPSDGEVDSSSTVSAGNPPPEDLVRMWSQILDIIRPQSRSVEALLRDCLPLSFDGTILVLQFWYVFHKNKLDIAKNRNLVEEAASQVAGAPVKIKTELGDRSQRPKKRPMGEEDIQNVAQVENGEGDNLLDAAMEIFGGEIIE
jgi:DNA polymerase-3 subunit gamma/tau